MLAIGISACFIYYHLPLRLRPAPLIFQKAGARLTDRAHDLIEGSQIQIFDATNCFPVGPRDNRAYSVAPDTRLHHGNAHRRIGEEGTTLTQIYEWSTRAGLDERPYSSA